MSLSFLLGSSFSIEKKNTFFSLLPYDLVSFIFQYIDAIILQELQQWLINKSHYINNTLIIFAQELSHIPEQLCLLTNLIKLDISNNQISTLAPSLSCLSSLTILDLACNKFNIVPSVMYTWTSLHNLNFYGNQLTNLDPNISKLTNLKKLQLCQNNLKSLPNELSNLTNLTSLRFGGNKIIRTIPECLSVLTNLLVLDINCNTITQVPEGLSALTNLTLLQYDHSTKGVDKIGGQQVYRIRL